MGDGDGESGGIGGDGTGFGEGGFGDASGLTGSEGIGFGGDMSGIGFGDFGGLGDAFGDAGLPSMSLEAMFSDPTIAEGLLGDFGFSPDMGMANMAFGTDLSSAMEGLTDAAKADPFESLLQNKVTKAMIALAKFSNNPVISNLGKFGSLAQANTPEAMAKSGLAMTLGMANPALGMAFGLANMAGLTNGMFSGLNGVTGGTPSASPGGEDMGWESALPGLAGMYAGYRGMKDSGNMLGSLQSLYSQDSPYAQAMRKSLQRQDAAGGRRSQYGPREVELQAKLAQMASNQIPAMNQLQQRQNINRALMLQQGLGAFNKFGGVNSLKELFGMGGQGGLYDSAASDLLSTRDFGLGNVFSQPDYVPDFGFDFGL